MKYIKVIITAALTAFIVASCGEAGSSTDCVNGSGKVIRDTVKTENYSSVFLELPGNILFKKGDFQRTIIETDNNLLNLINIYTQSLTLVVNSDEFLCPTKLKLHLTMPDFDQFAIRGAGNIENTEPFSADRVETIVEGSGNVNLNGIETGVFFSEISGSGNIFATGTSDNASARIEGSGNINLEHLLCGSAVYEIEGSGNVRAAAEKYLKVRIYGSGNIYYKGSPEVLDVVIEGTGSIIKID